jgi:hypothetical protein
VRWRDNRPEKVPRPEVKRLSNDEKEALRGCMENGVRSSPVLSALNVRVRTARGRLYYERPFSGADFVVIGRVTPLATPESYLLLEVEYNYGSWKQIAKGGIRTITNAISGDKKGTFHGLGALDSSMRLAKKYGKDKLEVAKGDGISFYYTNSNKQLGVQEVLYHYFGVPVPVIAEPRKWYIRHRTPRIREVDIDADTILVDFTSSSMCGDSFGGTCLYMKIEGQWNVFTIRPNQSLSIESSLSWLEKRKWQDW